MNRSPPQAHDWLMLFSLVIMWGSAFLFTKLAVASIPPTTLVAGRISLATVILLALVISAGHSLRLTRRHWGYFLAMSITGNCLPFFLISWGQQHIDSGLAGILMAVMPLATLVLAHFFVPGERMNTTRLSGFVLGFLGIIVLTGPQALLALAGDGLTLVAQLAVLGGALCYAINTIIARHRPDSDARVAAAGVLLLGTLLTLPLALIGDQAWRLTPTPLSLAALAALGLLCTATATVVYFKLITSAGPTFLSLINYLIPLWALLMGMIFMGEQPNWNALLALGLILAGIMISQRAR